MVTVKLTNVSVKSGKKFRHNQNYTMTFWKYDGVDENSTIDDIRNIIKSYYNHEVILNQSSNILIDYVN